MEPRSNSYTALGGLLVPTGRTRGAAAAGGSPAACAFSTELASHAVLIAVSLACMVACVCQLLQVACLARKGAAAAAAAAAGISCAVF